MGRRLAGMGTGVCVSLLLAGASLQGQSTGARGPLHLQSESQKLADLMATPDTINRKVANASSLLGIAVDPTNADNEVVLSGSSFLFSSDRGAHWSTDFIPYLGVAGYSDLYSTTEDVSQSPLGIVYDRTGHTVLGLNEPSGPGNPFAGTVLAVAEGLNHGQYLINSPRVALTGNCGPDPGYCNEDLIGLGIMADQTGTAKDGTIYLYYSTYCGDPAGCGFLENGKGAVLFATSAGPRKPFQGGGVVSNLYNYVKPSGASGVIDSTGTPHFFYTDLGESPTIDLILDQAFTPLVQYTQVGYPATQTGIYSTTPSCVAQGLKAYCAFNAGSLGPGAPQPHGNIYLTVVDLPAGTATTVQVNNDPPGKGKNHLSPSVTVTPNGDVYVGWFDDRRDPSQQKLDYFLGRSTDGGKTFPMQQPINEVPFTALLGVPASRYPPNFTGALAAGADGVVHAVWTDTRDGATVQVYTRNVQW